jgi:hypothetical protein
VEVQEAADSLPAVTMMIISARMALILTPMSLAMLVRVVKMKKKKKFLSREDVLLSRRPEGDPEVAIVEAAEVEAVTGDEMETVEEMATVTDTGLGTTVKVKEMDMRTASVEGARAAGHPGSSSVNMKTRNMINRTRWSNSPYRKNRNKTSRRSSVRTPSGRR